MTDTNKGKWKQYLLGTSLPLEHLTTQRLETLGFGVRGPFRYIRPNADGVPTEFSVDIAASRLLVDRQPWGELHLLAECKYASPSVNWVFAPLPSDGKTLFRGNVLITQQSACSGQVSDFIARQFLDNVPLCGRAVALSPVDAGKTAIEHGLYQVRYAIARFVAEALEGQHVVGPEYGVIQFILPALVTTASLWVLKPQATLDTFHSASDLRDVADPATTVIGYQSPGPHLRQFADAAGSDLLRNSRRFAQSLDAVHKYGTTSSATGTFYINSRAELLREFPDLSRRVSIISYSSLDDVIGAAVSACEKSGETWHRFGTLVDRPNEGYGETIELVPIAPQ